MKYATLILSTILLFSIPAFPEGTKQIQPTAAHMAKLQIMPNWTEFAWYDRFGVSGNPEYRLNIHISQVGEVIYFGFGDPLTAINNIRHDMSFRICDPLGNVVYGPFAMPETGTGYIPTYSQAITGPSAIYGAGGYPAFSYTPTMTGDYFLEFDFTLTWNNEHKQCKIKYFDVTVADAANNPKPGRLWSKAWQFSCDANGNPFDTKMYVYTTDSVVTAVTFNGMDPYEFNLVCNRYGCTNTGNFLNDRLSRAGLYMPPQYKVFLNDPDILAYPTGTLGSIIPPALATPDCHGNIDLTLNVTHIGNIEILLDIDPTPGIQSADTVITASVVPGINHIIWNGIDGNGNQVPWGSVITATVTYYNGLTNLPVYDVENNPNGYKVDLVRPSGQPVMMYWDDHLIGGTVNLTGCDYNLTGGCHPFTGGTGKTVNTWWYVINPTTAPIIFTYLTTPYNVGAINGPTKICPNSTGNIYWIHPEPNSSSYIWSYSGTGCTITSINDTTVSLAMSITATPGILTVKGYNSICGPGPASTFNVQLFPVPNLTNSPASQQQCNNLATNITLTTSVPGTMFTWTATGSSPNITGFANNTVPATLINQTLVNGGNVTETVTYHTMPQANGCFGAESDFLVTVFPTATLTNNPASQSQCNNLSTGINLTSNVAGTTFTWTCTPSSASITGYANSTIPGTTINQNLQNTGFNIENVVYHVTPIANGCNGTLKDYTVTVFPTPNLSNTPLSKNQCNNQNTNIALTSNVAGTLFTWTAVGSSPSVTGFANNNVPSSAINHTLVNSGYNIETVTYSITPHANGCNGPVYTYTVTVYPTPDLTNNPLSQSQCNNTGTNISLTSHVGGTQFTWMASGSSPAVTGFSNNAIPATLINHTLVNNGYNTETVTYQITPTANGCAGNIYTYTVTVYPTPDLSNTPASKSQCNNMSTGITLTSHVTGTLFTWTATASSGFISGYSGSAIPTTTINQTLVNSGYNIETVTYHVTPHANGCNGPVTDYTVTVYPTPNLSNTPLSKSQCDNLNTNITLTSNVTGTLFTWTATGSSSNITGFMNGPIPGTQINQTLDNSGFNIETVTYHITPTANGCSGPVYDYVVTVFPTPDLSNTPLSKSQCNNQNTNITLTSHVAGTLFTWTATGSSPSIAGYSNNNIPSTLISHTLINSGYNTETVTYAITPAANGCTGPVTNYVVTVYPTPDLSTTPLSKSQCNNQNTNIALTSHVTGTLFIWTATGSSANITGYANSTIPATQINQVLNNSGYNSEKVTYHITPIANGCSGTEYDYVVTVFPTPDVSNSPLSKSQCTNQNTNILLTSNVAGTLFTWTANGSSSNVTGFSGNSVPTSTISQILINSGFNNETVTYHITPSANGCSGAVYNYVVTVYPSPNLANTPPSQAQCNNLNTSVTLTSNVPGTLFTWTVSGSSPLLTGFANNNTPTSLISQVLLNSGYTTEVATYNVTPQANGCPGNIYPYLVTVYPTPDVSNNPLSKSQCNTTATNITLTSHVAGTLFTWTATGSSPLVTGYTGSAIPTTLINQILNNNGSSIETVTYHITPHANGCSGPVFDYTVTVYPTPDLTNSPLNKQQCNNTAANITLTSSVSGTIFSWTCTPSSVSVTGYSPGTGTQITHVLHNAGYAIETVTYHITPSANGCAGATYDYTVTVYPTPDLTTTPLNKQICNGTNTNIALTSHVAGTSFNWTCTASSPAVSGFSAGSGVLINQTLSTTSFTNEWVIYHITPVANGCSGIGYDYTVTLYPTANLTTSPLNKQQCNNLNTNIALTSNVAGATFSWTCTPSSPQVTGYSAGSGPLINQILVNSGYLTETVVYHITPSANGCTGPVYDYTVSVYPTPDISNNPMSKQICNNTNTGITLTSHVSGSTFSWTCTPSSPQVSGYSAGNGLQISQTLVNTGFNTETVRYHIVPSANGCSGATKDFTVSVYPVADVILSPSYQAICSQGSTNISIASNVTGATFSWTVTPSGGNITGYSAGNGTIIKQALTLAGYIRDSILYIVTATANGCPGSQNQVYVRVNPIPQTTFTLCNDPVTTINSVPIVLSGGVPTGGTYSGVGVSGGVFNPAGAGPGNHTIFYTYTNVYGCATQATQVITVLGVTPFTCGNTLTDVRDNKTYPTVRIGGQCWMAANLNYGTPINSGNVQRDNCVVEKYCQRENVANCTSLGGFYQWDEMMHYSRTFGNQGICPPGWHIPTEAEWMTLFNQFPPSNLGMAGSALKSTGFTGFDAVVNGFRNMNLVWSHSTFATMFWTATPIGQYKAWAHGMNTPDAGVSSYPGFRNNAYQVRCVKD